MMLVVSTVAGLGLFFAQRNAAENVKRDFWWEFQDVLAAVRAGQDVRHAALMERCRTLAKKPRLHAALEDNALDLLYPTARDELEDVVNPAEPPARVSAYGFHAKFYRFLDSKGVVIPPPGSAVVGQLSAAEEARLSLSGIPTQLQLGYLLRDQGGRGDFIDEIISMPIFSTESGEPIAALVLGFTPADMTGFANTGIKSGLFTGHRLQMPSVSVGTERTLTAMLDQRVANQQEADSFNVDLEGIPTFVIYKRLNPESLFAPAYEVCTYSLGDSVARRNQLFWQFAGAGVLLLLGALAASHVLSGRLALPVEKLAVDSEQNRAQRERAEAALELTSEELQRAARFSADASHQLKTPVTVLRAGLEELLTQETLTPEECGEISALIHQTFRLSSVIEDLLLLSRMDAGRLKIDFGVVDLTQLIEAALDDVGAQPGALNLQIDTEIPPDLHCAGEKRYLAIILQNLLENAQKYNRSGGRIRLTARSENGTVVLVVGNTGPRIPASAQEHIFERFHRGEVGENVPGYGLGLNLARELARLHGGELRLLRSDAEWTEFEVRLLVARARTRDPVGTV
jgi:signal transduction histidine kinase